MSVSVGWFTHHTPREVNAPQKAAYGLLEGRYAGGAEMSDEAYRLAAPDGVNVRIVTPQDFTNAKMMNEFDRVIVTGTDAFNELQLGALAKRADVVLLHHKQSPTAMRARLLNNVPLVIVHTPAHEQVERKMFDLKRVEHVLSFFDVSEIETDADRKSGALWAARRHHLKGELAAREWAAKNNLAFKALTNVPRSHVLFAMARTEWFVHLPIGFESECRAVMEAVLSGCRVHANENVGITSVKNWYQPDTLMSMMQEAPNKLWELILS